MKLCKNNTHPLITKPFSLSIVVHNTGPWTNISHLLNSMRTFKRFCINKPRYITPKMWRGFLIFHSMYPFSLLTTHITYDDGGSKQVDPLLTLYKRNKSHSLEGGSNIHNFPSLYSREKIDLIVWGSLTGSHQSPLTFFTFLSGPKATTVVWSILAYWFLCIISWHCLWRE